MRITVVNLVVVVLCISAGFVCSDSRGSKKNADTDYLTMSGVVPDLISHQPGHSVIINYQRNFVRQGNELTMSQVRLAPRVSYPNAKRGKMYTIFMLDPDAPSRNYPLMSPFLHYLVINAPRADNLAGETIVPYFPPAPPLGTDYHRYVFLVYEQKHRIKLSPMLPLVSRFRFTLDNLSEQSSALVGPVAANFFTAQFSLE